MNEEPRGRLYKRLIETKLVTGASASLMGVHDPGSTGVEDQQVLLAANTG